MQFTNKIEKASFNMAFSIEFKSFLNLAMIEIYLLRITNKLVTANRCVPTRQKRWGEALPKLITDSNLKKKMKTRPKSQVLQSKQLDVKSSKYLESKPTELFVFGLSNRKRDGESAIAQHA